MEAIGETIKKYAKIIGKAILKRILPPVIAAVLVIVILAGGTYFIMKWVVDKVNEKATEYTRSVSIDDNGTVSTGKTAEELWNEMLKAGYQVEDYLDGPEELARLMNAELVTQLPDMRANVEEPINWDAIFNGEWMISSQWAGDEPEYIERMRLKMKHYGSDTDYGCMVDCDNCRLTIFHKNGDDWELVAGWNTFQGSNTPYTSEYQNGGLNEAKLNWSGPRSRSFKGAWKIFRKDVSSDNNGFNNYGSSYVDGGIDPVTGGSNSQRFELTGYGDPDDREKKYCYITTGCCGLSQEHDLWVYNNVPIGTTVVVFDKWNPMPGWYEWDDDQSASVPKSQDLDYEALMEAEKKSTTNTKTNSSDKKTTIDEEKENGTTEETTTAEDKKATRDEEDLLTEEEKAKIAPSTATSDDGTAKLFRSGASSLQGIIRFKRYDKDGNSHYLTYATPQTFQYQVELYNRSGSEAARKYVMNHFTLKKNPTSGTAGTIYGTGSFQSYSDLTAEQLDILTRICIREQGSPEGAAAEASLMANLFELQGSSFGTGGSGLYNYVINSGWFGIPGYHNIPGSESEDVKAAADGVRAVLVNGYRTLPKYVDEHDCLSDITNEPANRSDFIQFQTVLHNVYGATYTFYCFPTEYADPFGYKYEENRQKYGDFCYEYGSWQPINGTEDKSIQDVKATGKTSGTTTSTTVVGNIRDVKTEWSDKIVEQAKKEEFKGKGWCLKWVDDVYSNAGLNPDRTCCAHMAYDKHCISNDKTSIPVGAAVYNLGSNSGICNPKNGGCGRIPQHVGIYIGNGLVMDNEADGVRTRTLNEWIAYYGNSWLGWGWEDPSLANGATIASTTSNYTGQLDTTQTGDGYDATYTSSAGITYKLYKQGKYNDVKYWDGYISNCGCGPTSIAILASGIKDPNITPVDVAADMNMTSGETLKAEMEKLGMSCDIIYKEKAQDITDALKAGKVMLVSVGSQTGFPLTDSHIMAVVDINSSGKVFVMQPGGSSKQSGWYDPQELITADGSHNDYIITTYAGVGTATSTDTTNSASAAPGYQAVVATYTEVDKSLDAAGPDVEGAASDFGVSLDDKSSYTISTTTVNYEDLVQPYTLQFDLLWTLLVLGQSKEFVFELADLAYKSDLEVSIFDNLTTTTDIDNCEYAEVTDAKIEGSVSCNGNTESINHKHYYPDDPLEIKNGHIYKTVITRTNTIQYALTKADTWIADYSIDCEYSKQDGTSQFGQKTIDDHIIMGFTQVDGNSHICSIISSAISSVLASANEVSSDNPTASGTGSSNEDVKTYTEDDVTKRINMQIRTKRVSMVDNTEDRVDTIKNNSIPNTAKSVIKDDEKTKPNFVTIFNSYKYRDNRNNILSAIEWFFEIIEGNERMANSKDIVRYLLSKATHSNYGVTELDNELFYPGKFNMVNGGAGGKMLSTGPVTGAAAEVVARAKSCLGVPYVYGSQNPPASIDCTGLVCYAYSGIVGRHGPDSRQMYSSWPRVNRNPQPGDVLAIPGHAALIIENNQVIEANGTEVAINPYKSVQDFINQGYAVVLPPQIPYTY